MDTREKIIDLVRAIDIAAARRRQGQPVRLVVGYFDVLTPDLVRRLREAAAGRLLIAAVLDHYAAGGIVDRPPRSDPGPTYVTIKDPSTVALPPDYARQYVFTTEDELQREATRSGRDIWFLHICDIEIAGSCATVAVGGDFVLPPQKGVAKMCCCQETELFLRRGDRWALRTSRVGACI